MSDEMRIGRVEFGPTGKEYDRLAKIARERGLSIEAVTDTVAAKAAPEQSTPASVEGGSAVTEFARRIDFSPAWHRVHEDPRKDYGVHGAGIQFYLTGPEGTVQFKVSTGWMLPETYEWWESTGRGRHRRLDDYPMATDLGYHSPTPRYEGQTPIATRGECEFIDGDCYYDGSGLNAEPVLARLIAEGHDGVWSALEDYYREVFKDAAQPTDEANAESLTENPTNPPNEGGA